MRPRPYELYTVVLLAALLQASSACGRDRSQTAPGDEDPGRGSRDMDSASPANVAVQLRGCVQRGDEANTFILRLADGGPIDRPGIAASPSASADANGGQTAAFGRTEGQAVGTSTTAGEPWPGTRAYRLLAPSDVDLARLTGSWVEVRGVLASGSASGFTAGGTDQQQARRGEPYRALRAAAVDVLDGRCPTGERRASPPAR
jgi:hypothetical protein